MFFYDKSCFFGGDGRRERKKRKQGKNKMDRNVKGFERMNLPSLEGGRGGGGGGGEGNGYGYGKIVRTRSFFLVDAVF